jgi:hypothetical protein
MLCVLSMLRVLSIFCVLCVYRRVPGVAILATICC